MSEPRRLRIPAELAQAVRGTHPDIKKKVKLSLAPIQSDPSIGKALKDDLACLRSFKTGRIRIIYKVLEQEIQIVAVGPRRTIYEETLRLIKREQ